MAGGLARASMCGLPAGRAGVRPRVGGRAGALSLQRAPARGRCVVRRARKLASRWRVAGAGEWMLAPGARADMRPRVGDRSGARA
jgi:hypothetical protein